MKRGILACLFTMCIVSVNASVENNMTVEENLIYEKIETAYAEGVLRETIITNEHLAVKALFSTEAAVKWKALTESNFSSEQIRDFFVGAVQLRGPVTKKAAVGGFYNPWWDTIFITESYSENVNVSNKEVRVRKIGDFRFLSGESFRGEKHSEIPSVESVLANEQLLPMTVAKLTAKTRKRFNDIYGSGIPLLADHIDSESVDNIKEIQVRSAMRLKMVQNLLVDASRYKESWQIAKVLRKSKKGTFDLLFSSDYAKMMSEKFTSLPMVLRSDFEPYAYYSSKDNSKIRMYVFVNVKYPRLFALAYLGLGYRKTVFEWFDVARADEILKAFKVAEEVKK